MYEDGMCTFVHCSGAQTLGLCPGAVNAPFEMNFCAPFSGVTAPLWNEQIDVVALGNGFRAIARILGGGPAEDLSELSVDGFSVVTMLDERFFSFSSACC